MKRYLLDQQINCHTEIVYPFSGGKNKPLLNVPDNACDSHHHIFDPELFPYQPGDPMNHPSARVEDYLKIKDRLHLIRSVIVTPSAYGTDNRATMNALKQLGDKAKAVVVLDETRVTEQQLADMDSAGVRGVRFYIPEGGRPDMQGIRRLAGKIAPMGWHLDFWMSADLTAEMGGFLNELPCRIAFDHRGHLPCKQGIQHPAFAVIKDLMLKGKGWVKLSAIYHDSAYRDSGYKDTISVGRAYVETAPDQVLWGTDWPHPSELKSEKGYPNDADLMDALYQQAGNEERVKKILVDNPARLYGFSSESE